MPWNGVQSAKDKVCSEKVVQLSLGADLQIKQFSGRRTKVNLPHPRPEKSCKPNFLLGHWQVGKRKKGWKQSKKSNFRDSFLLDARVHARKTSIAGRGGTGKQGGDERQQILFRILPELNDSSRFRSAESFDRSKFVRKVSAQRRFSEIFLVSTFLLFYRNRFI